MAKDLKPMLAKVLGSGGEKKFFFAYGVGKRKDKKGDGELAVGGKKPKKPDIEGALDACKEMMEGHCWVGKGTEDGGTIYFQCKGKKLSQMIVSKMALTAKQITGKQHDFQVPSPEEEARAEKVKIAEEEGDESAEEEAAEEAAAAPEAEEAAEAAAAPVAETTAPAAETKAPEAKAAEAKPAEKPAADAAAQYKTRLAEWTPAIKLAMSSKGPNAAPVSKLLAQASALAKPGGDFAQALALLTECHTLATKPAAAPAEKPAATDAAAEYKVKLAEWTPAIKLAMSKGPNAGAIAKLLALATGLAKPGGDAAQALAKLTEAHTLALATPAATPAASAEPAKAGAKPAGSIVKQRQFMLTRWTRIPAELKVSVSEYTKRLVDESADDNPEELGALVETYLLDLLAEIKDKLDDAINAGDTSAFAGQRASVAQDELLIHLASTPGMNGKKFADSILSAMGEIEAAMTA